jgi:hypothetical protein
MPDPTPIDRALCCGPTCGRGTEATGPCVAARYGHDIRQRAEAAGFAVVPAQPTNAMVAAAMGRRYSPNEPTLYHGIYRAMIAATQQPRAGDADG